MGYMKHHAILVTTWDDDLLEKAHAKAHEVFDEEDFPFWPDATKSLVSPIIDGVVNGIRSFFVAPDGSKEGWGPSDTGDERRARFVAWLDGQRYEDRSTSLDWVELQYGEDDYKEPRILHDGDAPAREYYRSEDGVTAQG